MDCKRNLTDEIANRKCPRGFPTMSTPPRQEKRIALRELVNYKVDHVEAYDEP